MYKVKYGLVPSIVDELFKQKSTSYSLRNSDFDIPTFNTINYGKHSLRYQGSHLWSKLDNKLKDSSNIEFFKKNIRKKDLTSLLNNNNSCCNLCQKCDFLEKRETARNIKNFSFFDFPNLQSTERGRRLWCYNEDTLMGSDFLYHKKFDKEKDSTCAKRCLSPCLINPLNRNKN